jgi:phosphatidylserine decarboxylase
MKTFCFIALQYLLPQHALSRLAGFVAETKITWIKQRFINWFIQRYHVDMSIAAEPDANTYQNFNEFFTRPLADGQRPITDDTNGIACPADGCISQIGLINNGHIFQAKGQEYSLLELVGGDIDITKQFVEGSFATIYLSPKDYHRVHMPLGGTLQTMIHVPGDLFSVNETTANNVPRLFARNERVVALFKTDQGPMAVILVGAMIVASIETVWAGLVTPKKKHIQTTHYNHTEEIHLKKGEEIGRFKLGSTAIVLFGKEAAKWKDELEANSPVVMGEKMGNVL